MKRWLLILLFFSTVGTAYAASKMAISENQEVLETPADQAQIIFIRPSAYGIGTKSSVFELIDGEPQFIGILGKGKKLAHFVEPGNHTFMVISEAADFMEANVVGGNTYYAVVKGRVGAWKARFSLHPVRNGSEGAYQIDSERFQEWMTKTKFVENTEASVEWANANHQSIVKKQNKFWKKWEAKSAEDIAERTLVESDGI
jgi:hypothetical protein